MLRVAGWACNDPGAESRNSRLATVTPGTNIRRWDLRCNAQFLSRRCRDLLGVLAMRSVAVGVQLRRTYYDLRSVWRSALGRNQPFPPLFST